MFFNFNKFIAVDIGTYSIKAVKMKSKKRKVEILTAKSKFLPYESIQEGKIVNSSIVASKLKDVFSSLHYKQNKIITIIHSKNMVIRNIEMPVMTEHELAEAVSWEAIDYLPFPVKSASIKYISLNKDSEREKILLIAVKKNTINSYISPFKKLSLKPTVINIQPMALLSLLVYQEKINEPLAVIDIGASGTRVIIGDKSNIYLARNIDIGGNKFTEILMEEKEIGFLEAEEYKINEGIKQNIDERNSSSLLSLANMLTTEINRSFEYFINNFKDKKINKVYYTGGGFKLKFLKEIICRKTNNDLLTLNPANGLITNNQKNIYLDYAVAIGLGISEVL